MRDYELMENNYKSSQIENYALREYVVHLQSRLVDVQGDYPQPPPNVNLNQPPPPGLAVSAGSASDATPASTAEANQLEAVAQAVAGLRESERLSSEASRYAAAAEKAAEEARTTEELKQQLNA